MSNIKVSIRVRPLIKRESDKDLPIQWQVKENFISPLDPDLKKRGDGGFYFDHIFDMQSTNYDVFDTIARPIIESAVDGFNGTIFAYGQTSSGKTYTMSGTREESGVIEQSLNHMFDLIAQKTNRQFLVRVAYIEIYNERVNDLLVPENSDLKIKDDPKTGQAYVECKEELVNSTSRILAIVKRGEKNRRIGETNMNERSSRSHTIVRLMIESCLNNVEKGGAVQVSQLNLVDLAGSERSGQTGAVGERFREGTAINMSLSSLGLVIKQLSDAQENPKVFVNFRDSKLTRILQSSLGGNANTTIICAITPAALEETQGTLLFASRAMKIKNKPKLNEEVSDAVLLKRYAKHIAKLTAELQEVKTTSKESILAETKSKLAAKELDLAEKERKYQILDERIQLLTQSLLNGNCSAEIQNVGQGDSKRRRTWNGRGTTMSKSPMFNNANNLPTIIEAAKTPEKTFLQRSKKRQSIIQNIDIVNETFVTAFEDFEIELIACEKERESRLSDGSTCDVPEDSRVTTRPQRSVRFLDDDCIINRRSSNRKPELESPERANNTIGSPDTPKVALRNKLRVLMEEYRSLCERNEDLEEFTKLERQMFVDDEVEKAMSRHNEKLAASEHKFDELNEKYAKLVDELGRYKKQDLKNARETSSIFENAAYFDEMNVSDVQADSILINDTQSTQDLTMYDSNVGEITVNTTVRSDFQDLKLIAGKLRQTVELLTIENTDLTNKLASEEERAKENAANLEASIEELLTKIHKISEEKNLLRNSVSELEHRLQSSVDASPRACIDEKNTELIENYKATIATLTAENEELSSNLMNKIEESDHPKDPKSLPIDHQCAYRELSVNLAERNELLQTENIELSTNLMEKIEECDRIKDSLDALNAGRSSASEAENLITKEKSKPGNVDDLARLSIGSISARTSMGELRSNGVIVDNLLQISILENGSECYKNTNGRISDEPTEETSERSNGSVIRPPTVDEMLRMSLAPHGTCRGSLSNDSMKDENVESWRSRAETLAEQVQHLQLLNDKLKVLKQISCEQCSHLNNLNENRKALKVQVKEYDRKLHILQEKYDRECADSQKLQTRAKEDLNISVCDSTMNDSAMLEGSFSVSVLEDRVQRLGDELETVKDKYGKLTNDYNEKCDEIEKLQVASSRETTPTPSSTDSPRSKRSDPKLDDIQLDFSNLKTDFRGMKRGLTKIKADQQKFDTEKAAMKNEIDALRAKKSELEEKLAEMFAKIDSPIDQQQFDNEKAAMKNEIDALRAKKSELEEKLAEKFAEIDSPIDQQKIVSLEEELSLLKEQLIALNGVNQELGNAGLSLQNEVQSLQAAKESLEAKLAETGDPCVAQEMIDQLELEVVRLNEQLNNSNNVIQHLQDAKVTLEAAVESLSAQKTALLETENSNNLMNVVENYITPNNNVDDCEKSKSRQEVGDMAKYAESLATDESELGIVKSQLQIVTDSLNKLVGENAAVNEKLAEAERFGKELSNTKLGLENEVTSLKAEIAKLESRLHTMGHTLREFENTSQCAEFESLKLKEEEKPVAEFENDSPYETLREYETKVEELKNQLQQITNELHAAASETRELNDELTKVSSAKEELDSMRSCLEVEVTNLKSERADLETTLSTLRQSLKKFEDENSALNAELEMIKAEKERIVENDTDSLESSEKPDSPEHKIALEMLNNRVLEMTDEVNRLISENEALNHEVAGLRRELQNHVADLSKTDPPEIDEELRQEVGSARTCITKEIKSLKPKNECQDLEQKTVSELFGVFVREIISKEQEIMKITSAEHEREKRKLMEAQRQSDDAEKRASLWAKELEAEVEKTRQDLSHQESKNAKLSAENSSLNNLLMERSHENQMLNEKMKVLELDFNTLQADLESKQNATLNSSQEKERLIEEVLATREMELSSKLRLVEKQHKEKIEELTNNIETCRMKNMELTNNLEGLEMNEKKLKSIVDMKTNELTKCNNMLEKLQGELKHVTEKHDSLSREHDQKSQQVEEITSLLKTKCDKLSEYKTKLETITPEYEYLKNQAAERQVRLEKYKSEIECMTIANDKQISSLRDKLESEEIKSAGYQKQLADLTNKNTVIQKELDELRTSCEELERLNAKLTKSMRNSTSKIRAEEEMEDLRDKNRTLQTNLEGAANRIAELQEIKTNMTKELVELRGNYEINRNENKNLSTTLAHHKSSVNNAMELQRKYEILLQEKNLIALELENRKLALGDIEAKLRSTIEENEKLKLEIRELNEEMDNELVSKIHDQSREITVLQLELHDKLEEAENLYKEKLDEFTAEMERLKSHVQSCESEVQTLRSTCDCLRNELDAAQRSWEFLKVENNELRTKIAYPERSDPLGGDSWKNGNTAFESEAVQVGMRRRRSRTELINQKRQLDVGNEPKTSKGPFPWGEGCRCVALAAKVRELELEGVTKNGEIATLTLQIQRESFPYMSRAQDLEQLLDGAKRKIKAQQTELQKLQELHNTETECSRCKQWKDNRRDQSSQCMPEQSRFCMSGGSVEQPLGSDYIASETLRKTQKTNELLKNISRERQKNIFALEKKVKALEIELANAKQSEEDEHKSTTAREQNPSPTVSSVEHSTQQRDQLSSI